MAEAKGLVIVNTGNGKGKTTAAMGMALRAWGQGLKILMLQFIKGGSSYGELKAAEKMPGFEIMVMGEGFIRDAEGDKMAGHRQAAREALARAREEITSGRWDMIILDEINYAVGFGLVSEEEVLELIEMKPPILHLVLTGRNATERVIEKADLVTEMREIKHPYASGIKAQKGVEF
jgi:cob(I)alamin adenosyltransferase